MESEITEVLKLNASDSFMKWFKGKFNKGPKSNLMTNLSRKIRTLHGPKVLEIRSIFGTIVFHDDHEISIYDLVTHREGKPWWLRHFSSKENLDLIDEWLSSLELTRNMYFKKSAQ